MATANLRFERFMNDSDAVMWTIERDPLLRSTIVAVGLLDRAPDHDRLVRRLEAATRRIPRLRQLVVPSPLRVAPPRWVADERFRLENHLRWVDAPSPKTVAGVLETARSMAASVFDRDRPLWDLVLVDPLENGGAAFILKLHHSVTDGIGAVRMALDLFDTTREVAEPESAPAAPLREHLGYVSLLRDATTFSGAQAMRAGRDAAASAGRAALRALRDPARTARDAVTTARSIARILAPVTVTLSPVMRRRSSSWTFHTLDLPLDRMLRAAHASGGRLNDAFVSGLASGFRRYHDDHGAHVSELRMTMPISYRGTDDPLGGNRFVPARLTIPLDVTDAAEQVHAVARRCHAWQSEPALPLTNTLASVLDHLPARFTTWFFGAMLKHVDFVSTNVPGLDQPVYFSGARVERLYAFAPPVGAAASIALLTYGGRCCIGINTDDAAIPDGEHLVACIAQGLAEVLALDPQRDGGPPVAPVVEPSPARSGAKASS